MNTRERKESMFEAVEAPGSFSRLRDVIVAFIEEGVAPDILIRDMTDILALLTEEQEDTMLEVMDQLVGHCQRTQRILPRPEPGDADYGIR